MDDARGARGAWQPEPDPFSQRPARDPSGPRSAPEPSGERSAPDRPSGRQPEVDGTTVPHPAPRPRSFDRGGWPEHAGAGVPEGWGDGAGLPGRPATPLADGPPGDAQAGDRSWYGRSGSDGSDGADDIGATRYDWTRDEWTRDEPSQSWPDDVPPTWPGDGGAAPGRDVEARGRRGGLPGRWALRRLVGLACWVAVVLLAVLALIRFVGPTWPSQAIIAEAVAPLLTLPAMVVTLLALAVRRWRLSVVAALLTALFASWLAPDLGFSGPQTAPPGATKLRLFSSNVYEQNGDPGIGREIQAARPDVVVLVEATRRSTAPMRDVLAGYPYSSSQLGWGAFGVGVWSRYPLEDVRTPLVAGLPSMRMTLRLPAGPVKLYAVHTVSPTIPSYIDKWRAQLDDLRRELTGVKGPVVLAGDFNATRDHRWFRRVLDTGVRDAHDAAGAGFAPTWPRGMPVFPPMLRIDHVLVGEGVSVLGQRTGTGRGSDHRPLVTDLAIR